MDFLYRRARAHLENICDRWQVIAARDRRNVRAVAPSQWGRRRARFCCTAGNLLAGQHGHAGRRHAAPGARRRRTVCGRRVRLRSPLKEAAMIFDYSLAALVTVGLMIYLVYALLRPEHL